MRFLLAFAPLSFAVALFASCSSGSSSPAAPDASAGDDSGDEAGVTIGGDRPVTVRVPAGYDPTKPAPLVMMLHGYSSANILTEYYFPMHTIADEHGFFYVAPNGNFDSHGARFWNATDACCDLDHTGVDDSGYLASLIAETRAAYNIDPKRIYVMGHSNGGFMSHRMACDHADVVAAIASYAGAVWSDPTKCNPSAPVGILQVHGTADTEVLFAGDLGDAGASLAGLYPSAAGTLAIWAQKNQCPGSLTDTGMPMHVNVDGTGNETTVSRYDGCPSNAAAELWAVQGAGHVFSWTPAALEAVWAFFEAHAKTQ